MSEAASSSSGSRSPRRGATATRRPTAALVRELARRGHDVLFLERDCPGTRANRDLPRPPYGRRALRVARRARRALRATTSRDADLVIVGSYVPEGVAVGDWVLADRARRDRLLRHRHAGHAREARARRLRVPRRRSSSRAIDLYLSFTGGPTLGALERELGAPARAAALLLGRPGACYLPQPRRAALGPRLPRHLQRRPPARARAAAARAGARGCRPARFVVAGPQYPADIEWPANVDADRAPAAGRAPRLLQRAALHAQRHARGHGRGGLVAERAAVRGRGLRRADDLRPLGGPRASSLPAGDPHRRRRRRRAAVPAGGHGRRRARPRVPARTTPPRRAWRSSSSWSPRRR